jgi:4-hydroxybenzoate polyprenyltransferase
VYRLRKLEMANLAAATSIAVALQLSIGDIVARTAFAFLLNVVVYLNNDYIDAEIDAKSADKDNAKALYLQEHIRAALGAQIFLVLVLAMAAAIYDLGLLVPLVAGGGICWWYSARLKQKPYLDIIAMMAWGLTMPLCGTPVDSVLGWCLAAQLALFSGVFESIQVMRDAEEDAAEGVRTTGVALGKERTLTLARIIMAGVSLYGALVMHPVAAVVSAGAFLVPFVPDRIEQYWTRVKLVYGITWLFICAWVFFTGQSSGLLWSIDAARG